MKSIKHPVVAFLFFLVAAYALYMSSSKPIHNWDMIMYIAAAKSLEESDVRALHTFTYEQLKSSVSAAEYETLVKGDYRHAISTDASAFSEQLSFYQIRPLYNGVNYLLYKAGINLAFATHIVSAIAVMVAMVFLYFMSSGFLAKPFIYAIPLLAFIFGITELAQFSTPDALAFLAVIVSAYLYLKQRILLLLVFIPIMVCVRTDLILFTVPLLLFIILLDNNIRGKAVLSMVTSIILYVALGAYWDNPGWSTIVYFTLVEYLPHPISMPPTLTIYDYFRAFYIGLTSLLSNKLFLFYAVISLYSLYIMMKRMKATSLLGMLNSPFIVLSLVCMLFFASHFLAFPVAFDRFFSGIYLIGAFSLLCMIDDKNTQKNTHKNI